MSRRSCKDLAKIIDMTTSKPYFDLVLTNAHVATFTSTSSSSFLNSSEPAHTTKYCEEITTIGITGSKITALGHIPSDSLIQQKIDLKGLTVFPGLIDSQVHFREPGLTHKEDIESGSKAALLGGITTYFEMPNTNPSTTTVEAFEQKLKLSHNRAHTNYAYFIGGSPENYSQLNQLENLKHCSGVKIFLGSSFGNLLIDQDTWFEDIVQNGHRRLVIHSEDEARLKERKHIAIDAAHPRVHHLWRDEESALISTKKSVALAHKHQRKMHILHVSSSEEMNFLKNNKTSNQVTELITVETLPQYLVLSAPECYERLGTLAQQNPPIRDKRHLEHLWRAVLDGTVDVIGSDHAPHTLEEKNKPYPQSPSGVPGVQTLALVLLDLVAQKKLPLQKFVQLLTENPRRIFSLKNKGRIQVGYDADLSIFDLQKTKKVEQSWLASKSNWSPFENMALTGWPYLTILNGKIALNNSEIVLPHSGQPCDFEI